MVDDALPQVGQGTMIGPEASSNARSRLVFIQTFLSRHVWKWGLRTATNPTIDPFKAGQAGWVLVPDPAPATPHEITVAQEITIQAL